MSAARRAQIFTRNKYRRKTIYAHLQAYKPLVALVAILALFFCAACSSEGEDESLVTANELSGTYWAGSVALGETTIPLTLNFTSTTDVTVGVTIAINRDVTCTYTISGNSIAATGTGDTWSGNNITFNVASYDGNTLKVTVASSSGEYFKLITAGTEIEFELSEVSTDENSTEE